MVIVIGFILTAICLVVLAWPFFRKGPAIAAARPDWRTARQGLYGQLRLLEQERELGHLSEADFQKQAEEIRLQAAELVRLEELEARAAEAARPPRAQARRPGRQAPRH